METRVIGVCSPLHLLDFESAFLVSVSFRQLLLFLSGGLERVDGPFKVRAPLASVTTFKFCDPYIEEHVIF